MKLQPAARGVSVSVMLTFLAIGLTIWLLLACLGLMFWWWLLSKRDRDWYDQ